MKPQQMLHLLVADFTHFFKNRNFTLNNFNLFLQVCCEQGKDLQAEEAFQKMELYGLKPSIRSYAYIIEVFGKQKNVPKAKTYFDESLQKIGWNVFTVNALLFAYSKNQMMQEAMNIFNLAEQRGIKMNCVTYTSLIQAAYNKNDTTLCWTLYRQMEARKVPKDDLLVSFMMKVCSRTGDSEHALKLWKELNGMKDLRLHCLHYNSLIKALSVRKDYCQLALEFYDEMIEKKIQPDLKTFEYTLWACAGIGNVKMAYEIAQSLLSFNLPPNPQVYQALAKTYAVAISNEMVPISVKRAFLDDAWKMV